MILCFISVIWNVCLKGMVKSSFCSFVRVGIRNSWIFPKLVKLDHCAVADLLEDFEGINFEWSVCMSFQMGMFIIFDSAPESIKKSISRVMIEKLYFLDFLKEVVLSNFFLWVVVFCLMRFDIYFLCLNFL